MSFRGELPPLAEISDKSEDKEEINLVRQDSALAKVQQCENFCLIFR